LLFLGISSHFPGISSRIPEEMPRYKRGEYPKQGKSAPGKSYPYQDQFERRKAIRPIYRAMPVTTTVEAPHQIKTYGLPAPYIYMGEYGTIKTPFRIFSA
jgi:hypothetical protein